MRQPCTTVVKGNLKDFPDAILNSFGIEAQHPDEFILHLLGLSPGTVLSACASASGEPQKPAEDRIRISGYVGASGSHADGIGSARVHRRHLAAHPCRPAIPYA